MYPNYYQEKRTHDLKILFILSAILIIFITGYMNIKKDLAESRRVRTEIFKKFTYDYIIETDYELSE